eukprot:gene5899-33467_t
MVLLPATTCMPGFEGLNATESCSLVSKPFNTSFKKLMQIAQNPDQVEAEQCRLLLAACQYRMPYSDHMLYPTPCTLHPALYTL